MALELAGLRWAQVYRDRGFLPPVRHPPGGEYTGSVLAASTNGRDAKPWMRSRVPVVEKLEESPTPSHGQAVQGPVYYRESDIFLHD